MVSWLFFLGLPDGDSDDSSYWLLSVSCSPVGISCLLILLVIFFHCVHMHLWQKPQPTPRRDVSIRMTGSALNLLPYRQKQKDAVEALKRDYPDTRASSDHSNTSNHSNSKQGPTNHSNNSVPQVVR